MSKFFFLILFLLNPSIFSYKCGADSINIKPHLINSTNDKRKLSNEYRSMKIKVDYAYLESQNLLSSTDLTSLKKLFEETTNYISLLFSVEHVDIKVDSKIIEDYCTITKVSPDIINSDFDLLIFPLIDTTMDKLVIANAASCISLKENLMPKAGIVNLNKNLLLTKRDSSYYIKYILFHELSHVLGFNPMIFQEKKLVYTKNGLTYINSERVLQKARQHFNCPSIEGIQLENQGGDGSAGGHWEARYMLGDYMISTEYSEIVISDITLALFEDTGFYKVNYYTGGLFRFGKNKGCKFFEKECVTKNGKKTDFSNEFCTEPGIDFCSSGHLSKGECYIVKYKDKLEPNFRHYSDEFTGGFSAVDYCPVSYPFFDTELNENYNYPHNCNFGEKDYFNIGEKVGKKSLCFESSLISLDNDNKDTLYNACYGVECNKKKKEYQVSVGNALVNCKSGGSIVENPNGFTGKINCPPYNIICSSTVWCNELFQCIDLKSEADTKTYDSMSFISLNKVIILLDMFLLFIL